MITKVIVINIIIFINVFVQTLIELYSYRNILHEYSSKCAVLSAIFTFTVSFGHLGQHQIQGWIRFGQAWYHL